MFELVRLCSNTTNEQVIIFNTLQLNSKYAVKTNLMHSKENTLGKIQSAEISLICKASF